MATRYHVRRGKKTFGPFDGRQLKQLAAAGKLNRDDSVSADGTKWTFAGDVKGLFPTAELLPAVKPRPKPRPDPIPVEYHDHDPLAELPPTPAIPRAVPAQPAAAQQQPTIVYVQAPAAAPQSVQQNTTVVVNYPRGNACAVLAAVLGLFALLVALIPVLGLIVLPLAAFTVVLALVGFVLALTRGGTGLVGSVLGGVLALAAVPVSIATSTLALDAGVRSIDRAFEEAAADLERAQAATEAEAEQ